MTAATVLVYVVSAVLRVAVTVFVGAAAIAIIRRAPAAIRYRCWQFLLFLCVVLPFVPGSVASYTTGGEAIATLGQIVVADTVIPGRSSSAADLAPSAFVLILIAGTVLRLLWLGAGLTRLRRLAGSGIEVDAREVVDEHPCMLTVPATIRYVPGLHQPATCGVIAPVVLLPEKLRACSANVRAAVLSHELIHVRCKHWLSLMVEEIVRAIFWFHPVMWWVIGRIQATREEVVDALTVAVTGDRRSYIEALLAFSDEAPVLPAPAFVRQRHLFRRIQLVSKESRMSQRRASLSFVTVALVSVLGSWYAIHAFPLQQDAGPVERQARAITPEHPIPRRLLSSVPRYPQELTGTGLQAFVTAQITIDSSGTVVESRLAYSGISRLSNYPQPAASAVDVNSRDIFWEAVRLAVSQWQYEPPADPPISFPVSFRFAPDRDGLELNATTAPFNPAPVWHAGAELVGDGVAPPAKIRDVRPAYPPEAVAAKVQGVVLIEVRIEPDGKVSHTRVMRSIPQLDEAALDAVKQWEFAPPLGADGRPAAVLMIVTVQFTLS